MGEKSREEYWQRNIKLVIQCMIVWFVVSFGFGILLVHPLNAISIGRYKLGFWFAQQGSIYVFTILIFVYIRLMNKLDKKYNLDD